MRIAIISVRNGEMSYKQASETFAVPRTTLERHMKETNLKKAGSSSGFGGGGAEGARTSPFGNSKENLTLPAIHKGIPRLFSFYLL